ncbi:type II toxin-antitoxin system CcdA family antitoxin [Candidatus Bathyarchaeota archaeon]|nr:type II toxin-antitoxin system CcdA family antitoxin [Candidatus Bathyarchaeota archaeon]
MSNKVICTIYINKDVKERAHRVGINISKATENVLRVLLGQLSSIDLSQAQLKEIEEKSKEEPTEKRREVEEMF